MIERDTTVKDTVIRWGFIDIGYYRLMLRKQISNKITIGAYINWRNSKKSK